MDKTIGALCKLLKLLYQEQAKAWTPQRWGEKAISRAQEVWEELSCSYWQSVREQELEKWLSASNELHIDFPKEKKVLYLPPLENDSEFVPVLSLKCDLNPSVKLFSIRLRVMLVRRSEDENKLCGIGFRLESPESESQKQDKNKKKDNNGDKDKAGQEGTHDFYHAQLISDFGHKPSVESPSWLPEEQPSFPLIADCPVTLLISLLLTLYGKNSCWEFYTKHHLDDLKQYMNKLNYWIKWKSFDRR